MIYSVEERLSILKHYEEKEKERKDKENLEFQELKVKVLQHIKTLTPRISKMIETYEICQKNNIEVPDLYSAFYLKAPIGTFYMIELDDKNTTLGINLKNDDHTFYIFLNEFLPADEDPDNINPYGCSKELLIELLNQVILKFDTLEDEFYSKIDAVLEEIIEK